MVLLLINSISGPRILFVKTKRALFAQTSKFHSLTTWPPLPMAPSSSVKSSSSTPLFPSSVCVTVDPWSNSSSILTCWAVMITITASLGRNCRSSSRFSLVTARRPLSPCPAGMSPCPGFPRPPAGVLYYPPPGPPAAPFKARTMPRPQPFPGRRSALGRSINPSNLCNRLL